LKTRTQKILILLSDFVFINIAWFVYYYIRIETGWFKVLIMPEMYIPMLVMYFYWLIIFTFFGMYRTWFAASRFDEISTLFKTTFIGIFILFFLIFISDYLEGAESNIRILIFIYWSFLFAFVSIGRLAIRSFQRALLIKGIGRRTAVIVGFNSRGQEVHDQILQHPALGLDVSAYVAVHSENVGKIYKDVKVVDNYENLLNIVEMTHAAEIIIALEKENHDLLVEIISRVENREIGLKIVPDLYEILSGQARTSQLYGIPLIDIMPELMPEWEKKLKRISDVIISLLVLLITLPLNFLVAVAIKLDSRGRILFKQDRIGMNGKEFKIYKFRSMHKDAEKNTGPVWSSKDDPRVTRIGKIIRKLRIDEIPQFFNVLKGEMSLVGPRPERPYFVEMLAEQLPYYKRRLKVRPGITGWAQVKHKYDESIEDVKVKLRYDLFYIENMSIRMDLKILARTVLVVIFGKGHYS
jgi:exopolysaccharide biosynthesis polyprenyl glycosylphosphotransferase